MKKDKMHFYQLLRDFLQEYLLVIRNFSKKTFETYRQSLNQYRLYLDSEKGIRFDHVEFSCFSRDLVYSFLVYLRDERGCATQTLNLRLSAIKSFLKYCGEEDISLTTTYLSVAGIHAFKGVKKSRTEYLTDVQLKELFSAPDSATKLGRRDRFFMIFTYETGARIQELLGMKLQDIIRNGSAVKVRILGKGSKIRYVPLLESTIGHLDSYLKEFHSEGCHNDYLFYTVHDRKHTQMKPGAVDYFLKKYGSQINAVNASFPSELHAHMLRHSIAMAMYKNGIPISYIKDFLGHSSINTTAVYSYADEETVAKALEAVDHEPSDTTNTQKKNWKGKEEYLLQFCGLS